MNPATITLLDMGEKKYGDSVLCQFGAKRLLIDGGHLGDHQPTHGYPSLPDQLRQLTGQWPLEVDLLVVTHCHADHIGCLPTLVTRGELTAKWALVADPDLGWGKIGRLPDSADAPTAWDSADTLSPLHTVVTALFDDRPTAVASDAELAQILADAARLWDSYNAMIDRLRQKGTKVVRYGVDSHTALVKAFADCGLKILGPTKRHLLTCARELAKIGRDALAEAAALAAEDSAPDPTQLLRRLASDPAFASDAGGAGAALNSQSIVLRLDANTHRVLLTGDMQFADAQVSGLDADMTALRKKVRQAGPYLLVKTPHHTANNGISSDVLADWGPSALLAHSGGLKDPGHPAANALAALKQLARPKAFARTDRNGQIRINLAVAKPRFTIGRGTLDDFRVNPKPPAQRDPEPPLSPTTAPVQFTQTEHRDHIEIVARLPRQPTRVTFTVDVQPLAPAEEKPSASLTDDSVAPFKLGGGTRTFPKLLFVTSAKALTANIGPSAVSAAFAAIRAAGGDILDELAPGVSVQEAATRVHAALLRQSYAGIVLLGGYDVVPSARLDTVGPELRAVVENDLPDADDFIVWSDSSYADTDHDTFSELPVTRIPDAKSRELFIAALTADTAPSSPRKLSVRNARRPFAAAVFRQIAGRGSELVSMPATTREARAAQADMQGNVYLMLHGSDGDGSALWGEDTASGRLVESIELTCLPGRASGVIFTGACWGALTVTRKAATQPLDRPPQSKSPDQSLALAALRRGYLAFIGCTGSHYSPLGRKADSAGGPLHMLFWKYLSAGKPPAEALFAAKSDYAAKIPYRDDPIEEAVDQKIVRQFTCLGLGW